MAVLSRCCCCCTIRNGSIATAIYSMLLAAIALGLSSYKIHIYETYELTDISKEENGVFVATCVDLGLFSLLFFLSIMMLYGIKNNKRFLLLPYIVCMTVLVVLLCVLILLLLVLVVSAGDHDGNLGELVIVSLFTGLNLYCVLCVISYYQELKEGRYRIRAVYQAQGGMLPNTDNQPVEKLEINNLQNANFVPQYPGSPSAVCSEGAQAAPSPPAVCDQGALSPPSYFMMGAPPPYQPPAYPAETYPKGDVQMA